MPESGYLEGYTQTPAQIKIHGEATPIETHIDLREPRGETFLRQGSKELIAPGSTDFPISSGDQLQVVDREVKSSDIRETPLLSDKVDPKRILALVRMGIITERQLIEKTRNVWANFNLHSRPPMSADAPIDAQYDSLTLDIHGRDIADASNWAMPPPIHAGWGAQSLEQLARLPQPVDETGRVIPATAEEIEAYKHDPNRKVLDQSSARIQRPEEFQGWRERSEGGYNWEGGRRKYTPAELSQLRGVFGTSQFLAETLELDDIELFPDPNPPKERFEPNETDTVLWEFGGYQLVTQSGYLTDAREGIHMVLKLKPEPHTPWNNPRQTMEAYAIGLGVARLLKNTKSLEEIGDAYLDMNANWSMGKKRDDPTNAGKSLVEMKQIIQQDTRAHLHIQLEKMTAAWEIAPAPGMPNANESQSPETIEEVRGILNDPEKGLYSWIAKNATGRLPT